MKAGLKLNKKDLSNLNRRLSTLNRATISDVRKSLKDFGIYSQFGIKRDAPVDTSNLKQNVNWQMLDKNTVEVSSIAIKEDDSRNFDYAPVQEFGSAFRRGKPYFYPNVGRGLKKALVLLRIKLKNNVK